MTQKQLIVQKMMTVLDDHKNLIEDGEYLQMCNTIKKMYDNKDKNELSKQFPEFDMNAMRASVLNYKAMMKIEIDLRHLYTCKQYMMGKKLLQYDRKKIREVIDYWKRKYIKEYTYKDMRIFDKIQCIKNWLRYIHVTNEISTVNTQGLNEIDIFKEYEKRIICLSGNDINLNTVYFHYFQIMHKLRKEKMKTAINYWDEIYWNMTTV